MIAPTLGNNGDHVRYSISLGYPGAVRWQHFKPSTLPGGSNALHLLPAMAALPQIRIETLIGSLFLLMVSSSLYVSNIFMTRVLSGLVFSELSFSRIIQFTTGYTFTPRVGSFTSPGIDTGIRIEGTTGF